MVNITGQILLSLGLQLLVFVRKCFMYSMLDTLAFDLLVAV